MKKLFAFLAVAAMIATASPVFAHEEGDQAHREMGAKMFAEFDHGFHLGQNKFVFTGTVASSTTNSLVVNVKGGKPQASVVNGQVAVTTTADTKIFGNDKAQLTLSDLKTGDKVVVSGSISGSTLTAKVIRDKSQPAVRATGKVTAVSGNSVTITNGITGVATTVTANADTKVNINGESKTVADIQVGDSGWVRFKNEAGTLAAKFFNLFR